MPENVTLLPKTTEQVTGGNAWNERTVVLKKGDSVSAILRDIGATADELKAITAAFGGRGRDSSPKDGYKLRVLLAPRADGIAAAAGPRHHCDRQRIEAMVAWSDKGKYVAVDVRSANTSPPQPATTTRTTAKAFGSTRASMRRRCATIFRAP